MEKQHDYVEIQRLNSEENFAMWKFQVNILLKSEGLYETVYNKEPEAKSDPIKDAQVQKIIMCTINKKLLPLLMSCENAKQMFEKLCEIFEKSAEQQKCDLMQELFQYTYNKSKDMTHHISAIENLAYRLKNIGEKVNDNMLISKILSTLPDTYNTFTTAWDSTTKSEKTLSNLTARLLTEEKRLNNGSYDTKEAYFNKTHTYKNKKYFEHKTSRD